MQHVKPKCLGRAFYNLGFPQLRDSLWGFINLQILSEGNFCYLGHAPRGYMYLLISAVKCKLLCFNNVNNLIYYLVEDVGLMITAVINGSIKFYWVGPRTYLQNIYGMT